MNKKTADILILENLFLFDRASIIFDEITEEIGKNMSDFIQNWCNEKDWEMTEKGNYLSEDSVNFSPASWCADSKNNPYFYISPISDDCTSYILASLAGCNPNEAHGVYFSHSLSKKEYKQKLESYRKPLEDKGFRIQHIKRDSFCYYPIQALDVNLIPSAYADGDYEELLKPIADALDRVHAAIAIFDEIEKTSE